MNPKEFMDNREEMLDVPEAEVQAKTQYHGEHDWHTICRQQVSCISHSFSSSFRQNSRQLQESRLFDVSRFPGRKRNHQPVGAQAEFQ